MQIHISCMCVIFSNVSFHMCSQIASLNRCKVTIVADVQNFSSIISKSPSWTDLKWHKFQICEIFPIWFSNAFSNRLLEHMQSHISCMWVIFWNVSFHMFPRIVYLNRFKVQFVACERFFEMLVFTCLLKSPAWTDAKSNWIGFDWIGLDWIGFTMVYWCCHHSKGCPISLIFSHLFWRDFVR